MKRLLAKLVVRSVEICLVAFFLLVALVVGIAFADLALERLNAGGPDCCQRAQALEGGATRAINALGPENAASKGLQETLQSIGTPCEWSKTSRGLVFRCN